jgi:ribosomal-protein-alanine N-acetyltransferase
MLKLAAMQEKHLSDVLVVEELCFSNPWSRESFLFELHDNDLASYLVMVDDEDRAIAYGGMWLIGEEAHVTNIAVHPDYRRQQIGENIVRALMVQAYARGAKRMTLEVRRSNLAAQNLYKKLGFVGVGYRKGYYQDNKEDALIMWNNDLSKWLIYPRDCDDDQICHRKELD